MEDRRTLHLRLPAGDSRQLLLEAGSLILVIDGRLEIAGSPQWLAETSHCPRHFLDPEAVHRVEPGGWVTLAAPAGALCAVIAPELVPFWARVGRCLAGLGRRGPSLN